MTDSVSFYSKADLPKKKPVMLMIFNPDCDHCKHETEELVKNIDKFKNVHIVMASFISLTEINKFREKYNLGIFKNIVLAQDTHYFLLSFFMLHNMPFGLDKQEKRIDFDIPRFYANRKNSGRTKKIAFLIVLQNKFSITFASC